MKPIIFKNSLNESTLHKTILSTFENYGMCLLHKVPIDDLSGIPTPLPSESMPILKIGHRILRWVLQDVLNLQLLGLQCVKQGALFHNIVPTDHPDGKTPINDAAWDRALGYHQEMAFMNRPGNYCVPQALALLCLRRGNGERPTTFALNILQILEMLPEETISVLKLPIFVIRAPDFIPWQCQAQPILYQAYNNDRMSLTYTQLYTGLDSTVSVDAKACFQHQITLETANQHLTTLDQAYQKCTPLRLQFNEGDLLVLDNRFTHHARSIFIPNIRDRTQVRWLLRAYAVDRNFPITSGASPDISL